MTVRPLRVLRLVLLAFAGLWGACLWSGQVDAARWEDHRASALRAVDEADTVKAIEQFEAAIYYAQEQLAPDRNLAGLWEHLTAAYLADGQFRRAWDASTRWDKILAANAAEAWAPEQQRRRDQMTRLLFEQTRKTPAKDMDGPETAGEPSAASAAEAIEPPAPAPVSVAEPVQRTAAQAPERPAPGLSPAGEAAQSAAAPAGQATPEPAPESAPESPPESPPGPASEQTTYGIHLASFSSDANARRSWTLLQAQYPDLLDGKTLALRSVEVEDRGIFVRVIAVPYADSSAAQAVCRDLQRRSQYCAVLRPD